MRSNSSPASRSSVSRSTSSSTRVGGCGSCSISNIRFLPASPSQATINTSARNLTGCHRHRRAVCAARTSSRSWRTRPAMEPSRTRKRFSPALTSRRACCPATAARGSSTRPTCFFIPTKTTTTSPTVIPRCISRASDWRTRTRSRAACTGAPTAGSTGPTAVRRPMRFRVSACADKISGATTPAQKPSKSSPRVAATRSALSSTSLAERFPGPTVARRAACTTPKARPT